MKLTPQIELRIAAVVEAADTASKRYCLTDATLMNLVERESLEANAVEMLAILREIKDQK